MTLKVVISDFDGTLVESAGIKDEAFHALYSDEAPEHLDEIMAYHKAHNATLRFEKFRHIHERILGKPYTEADAARLSARFSELVFERIVAAPPVPGLKAFLEAVAGLPLYLVSMSPDEELARILAARHLDCNLAGVYPGSWQKAAAVRDILAREGAARGEAVYLGDTDEDRQVAEAVGVPFIGRDSGRLIRGDCPIYANLHGIVAHLKTLRAA